MKTKTAPAGTKSRGSATKTPSKTSPTTNSARAGAGNPTKGNTNAVAAGAGATTTTKRDPISHRRKPITQDAAATPARAARSSKKSA